MSKHGYYYTFNDQRPCEMTTFGHIKILEFDSPTGVLMTNIMTKARVRICIIILGLETGIGGCKTAYSPLLHFAEDNDAQESDQIVCVRTVLY